MDISNNYLKNIAGRHQFYAATDVKDAESTTSEYTSTGAQNAKSGTAGFSAARFLSKPILSVMEDQNKLPHLLMTGQEAVFSNELGAIKARTALVGREVSSRMHVLRSTPEYKAGLLPPDLRTPAMPTLDMAALLQNLRLLSPDVQLDGAEQQNSLFDSLKNVTAGGGTGPSSSWDICESIADAIDSMGSDYLDVFQKAVEKYASFYSDFSDFMAKLKDYMKAGSSSGDVILNGKEFLSELQKLMDKYEAGRDSARLFPNGDSQYASREECEAWCKEMGLDPDKCISTSPYNSDGYSVSIDTSPLQAIYDSVTLNYMWDETSGISAMLCNSAMWAAWQAGLDMQKDTIQTGMQTLTQKYSNANSTYDNLVKVLSSTITSLLDCDKGFLNI